MEKDVAIREWCIEKAIEVLSVKQGIVSFSVKELLETAASIETYILNKEK